MHSKFARPARAQMRCVVLSNGVVGAEKQALALARAVGLPFTSRRAAPTAGASLPTQAQVWLTSVLGERALGLPTLEPPPQLAISCGRASVPASVALRAASNGQTLTVHVQRPPCSASAFDLVVAPRHDFGDDPRSVPPNVLLTEGSLHSIDASSLRAAQAEWARPLAPLPRPRLALLLGGVTSRRWWQRELAPPLTVPVARELVRSATEAAAALGGSLLVSTSRRTPPPVVALLRAEMHEARATAPNWLWSGDEGDGPNPYMGFLAGADYVVVSADSVNMVSEACATAKPVYVLRPEHTSGRFLSFHTRMLAQGATKPWPLDGAALEPASSWSGSVAPDTQLAAQRVRMLLEARFGPLSFGREGGGGG